MSTESDKKNQEGRWSRWGRSGFEKSIKVSDWVSGYANAVSAKVGGERFWPMSNDMPLEIEKCERILRAFTVEGIPQKEEKEEEVSDGKGNIVKKKRKVLKKIPPSAIKKAKGICIFSSMRSGIAPFGGGGGAGLVLARLPDGSWSAPSAISPNNMSAGLLLGIDFIDAVLLINTDKALDTFKTHKFTIGAETAITAGPVGAGTSAEAGIERSPIFSYVRTRGMYAGVELMGQVFFDRFDENERFYYWPGIKAGDILTGKVRIPPAAFSLHRALLDAESGKAQGGKLERTVYDVVKMPESMVIKALQDKPRTSRRFVAGTPGETPPTPDATPSTSKMPIGEEDESEGGPSSAGQETAFPSNGAEEDEDEIVHDGEKLRLPPTPQELEALERAGIPDEEDARLEQEDRARVYSMPPPPIHPIVQRYWRVRPDLAKKRRTAQLEMNGPYGAEVREAQYVPLPSSPTLEVVGEEGESNVIASLEKQANEQVEQEQTELKQRDDLEDGKRARDSLKLAGERGDLESGTILEGVDEEEADRMMNSVAGRTTGSEVQHDSRGEADSPIEPTAMGNENSAEIASEAEENDANEHKIALIDNTADEESETIKPDGQEPGVVVPAGSEGPVEKTVDGPVDTQPEEEKERADLEPGAEKASSDGAASLPSADVDEERVEEVKAEAASAAMSASVSADTIMTNGSSTGDEATADETLKATGGKTESILPPPKRPPPRSRNRPAKGAAKGK